LCSESVVDGKPFAIALQHSNEEQAALAAGLGKKLGAALRGCDQDSSADDW
jgi:hypothetical protein